MTNGERIKYLREKIGLTQKDIATKLGVEPAAVSKYELDMREPNIEAIKKLAEIFNVSIDYLLGRTPDVFVSESDKEALDISIIRDLYKIGKRKVPNHKSIYKNENSVGIVANELMCGVGNTTYGKSKLNGNISFFDIESIINDFEKSEMPAPQIMLTLKDFENSIIIVEINSFDDEEMPLYAIDRVNLYTAKLSQKYNVLGLAIGVDKDENCRLLDAIYQKNKEDYHIQLHLPKTVLTAPEYIDIMSRV